MVTAELGHRVYFATAIDLVRRRRDLVVRLVTHRYPLADVAVALDVAARRDVGVGKVLIDVEA